MVAAIIIVAVAAVNNNNNNIDKEAVCASGRSGGLGVSFGYPTPITSLVSSD